MYTLGQLLQEVEPPSILYRNIEARIFALQCRRAKMRIAAFIGSTFVSIGALIPILSYAAHELYVSGFYDYLNLALSNHQIILSSWQNLGLLLFDSLPALGILGVLACVAGCIWSLSRIPANAHILFTAHANI